MIWVVGSGIAAGLVVAVVWLRRRIALVLVLKINTDGDARDAIWRQV